MTIRERSPSSFAALALSALALAGCTVSRPASGPAEAPAEISVALFNASDALEKQWRKVKLWRNASWTLADVDGEIAIRAVAEGASSVLARPVEIDPETCPVIEWTWRVDALPEKADLASRTAEDVAASIFLVFGDPGVFSNPNPVPTLRYAWTTEANPTGELIDSPYFSGTILTIAVRSGPARLGTWVTERRNVLADYQRAFGEAPDEDLQVFALFTDSDHGRSRVEAFYRDAHVLCREAPEEPSIFG